MLSNAAPADRDVVVVEVDLGVVVDATVDAVSAVVVLVGTQAQIDIRQRPPRAFDTNAEGAGFDADAEIVVSDGSACRRQRHQQRSNSER